MKLATMVSFVVISTAVFVPAQQSAPAQMAVLRSPPLSFGCPVSLAAWHLADGGVVQTGDPHPKGIGQALRLTLTSPDSRMIASATVTVHGFSTHARMIEAMQERDALPDAKQTVRLRFVSGSGKAVSANLWVKGFAAVATIELDSIAYRDGSVWKPGDTANCFITPDPLMLIAGR